MARQRYQDSDPVEEILRIAMQNQGGPDLALRQRLLASAAELGISEQAVLQAEQQWQEQKQREEELEEYRAHTLRSLNTHLGIFVVVNMMLVFMDLLSTHGHITWSVWPILGWGIGLGCHLVAAMVQIKNPGGEEFQTWKSGEAKHHHGLTIGVNINPPRAVRDPLEDRNQTQA
jgi:hypothetical protein